MKISTPPERIVTTDFLLMAFNPGLFDEGKRVVDLACGHKALVKGWRKTANCPRCAEMLRRSIATGEEDYDAFRNGNGRDQMTWADDPCRQFNEKIHE